MCQRSPNIVPISDNVVCKRCPEQQDCPDFRDANRRENASNERLFKHLSER